MMEEEGAERLAAVARELEQTKEQNSSLQTQLNNLKVTVQVVILLQLPYCALASLSSLSIAVDRVSCVRYREWQSSSVHC